MVFTKQRMHKKYKHIIWDWNGTLLDDAWLSVEVINSILKKYDKPLLTLDSYRRIFDFPVKDYYQRIGFDFSINPFKVVGTEFIEAYKKRWQECSLHRDAEKVLETIRREGLEQSVLSAADVELVKAFVDHYQLVHYFKHLSGLNHHYASGKIDIGKKLVRKIGCDPSEILMIGDTTHDSEVARALQIDCLLFTGGHHPIEKLAPCQRPLIHNLVDLLAHLNFVIK